ncbi:MAG: F0F1 ATP synthase subunit A, partial [Anaerolineae bacterium]|nr:F0F1 ATP synthase subunit A [Anaerolineae bacterium]
LLIALRARQLSNGWTRDVPGRFQGFVEVIVDGLWGLAKQQAGNKPKVKNLLFPIVASIFLYLLAANWSKLIPGVESVGVLHCAVYQPVAFNGHPIQETNILGRPAFVLRVDQPLNVGTPGTEKGYKQCEAGLGEEHYAEYAIKNLDPFFDNRLTHVTEEGDTLASIAADFAAQAAERTASPVSEVINEVNATEGILSSYTPHYHYEGWKEFKVTADDVLALNSGLTAEEAHEGEALTVDTPLAAGQTVLVREELLGENATTMHNQLYTVAPFVRGLATDLNVTLGMAIFAFLLIQYFGISELGLNYFQKFVNVAAIGGIAKRPLGAIDFVAGLFEIVSELGKIVSLSFRLFGAIFAGSILFAVFLFLFGTIAPGVILLLEIIVGGAQAGVFAILTLIFCAQAMVSHAHDDEHGHEAH